MATTYLTSGETNFTVSNNNTTLIGSTGTETVTIASGVTGVVLDQNTESVTFAGNSSAHTFHQTGNVINVYAADGTTLVATLPLTVGATDTSMTFDDGEKALVMSATDGSMTLGGDAVSATTPTVLTATTVTPVVVAGQTFVLTNGADIVPGTTGDDAISGLVVTNAISGNNVVSFSSIDIIDGGDGTDTLTVQVDGTANGATVANVENIVLTSFGTHTFSMGSVSGLNSLTNKGSINSVSLTAVGSILDLGVTNVNNNFLDVTYNGAALTGVTDNQLLTLSGASNGADITLDASAVGTLETLTIASTTSANTITLQGQGTGNDTLAATGTLIINGDADLSLTSATMAGLTTVTSTSTGAVTLSLGASAAQNTAVTTGTGNDSITTTTFTSSDSFDLGDGTDELVLTAAASATTATTITGVESLRVAVAADASLNLENATDLTTLSVGTGTDVITVTKAAATLTTVEFDNRVGTVGGAAYDSVTYALNTASGTADVLNVSVKNTNAQGVNVASTVDTQKTVTALIANGVETINVTATDMGADSSAAANDSGLVITTLTATSLTNLSITSDTLVTVTNALGASINTIDASLAAGGVVFDASLLVDSGETTFADKTMTITTGDGADTITGLFTGTAEVNTATVILGAGADALTVAGPVGDQAGAVDTLSINAGTGADTITLGNLTVATEATVEVTLGTGVDTLAVVGAVTQTGISVTDFVVGAGGDKVDFTGLAGITVAGAGAITDFSKIADGTNISGGTNGGMTIYSADDLGSMTVGALVTAAAAVAGGGTGQQLAHTGTDKYLVAASDGTDTGIFLITEAGGGATVIDAGEAVLLVTLVGVSSAAGLTVDNFTDFLA